MATTAKRSVTRDMPPLELRGDVVPSSLNPEARTVNLVWTTGAAVLRGYYDQYWEELSLDPKHVRMKRLNSGQAPLLNNHSSYSTDDVIGVVESATLDAKRGSATVRFAKDPISDGVFQKVADGILCQVSVGYRIFKMEKVEDGEGKVPVYRAVDWEPYEISPVPVGADAGAVFRSDNNQTRTNPCVFIEERAMDPDETPTPTPAPAPVAPAPAPSAAATATRNAMAARADQAAALALAQQEAAQVAVQRERERMVGIRSIAKQSGMGEAWATALIEGGTSIDEARTAAFEQLVTSDSKFAPNGGVRIGAGEDERDKWVRGATAWLLLRTGKMDDVRKAKERMPDHPGFADLETNPGEFRGMSPMELARQSLERCRVDTRGMNPMHLVGAAFTHKRSAGQFQTTSDFSILLENVLNKTLLGAYLTQQNTWTRFCKSVDVKDFRSSGQYRTGALPNLSPILEHGEYTTGAIPDGAKYTVSTGRLGKKFSLSREVIVNDDMGSMLQLAEGFGTAAARTIEVAVYALLAQNSGLGPTVDANPFFHSSRNNVSTGAALSVAALDADRVQLRTQKDPNGQDFLDLTPAVLLVPDSLYGQASVINDSQYDVDKVANGRMQEPNRVRGLFREVVGTPRLTGTRRYVFAQTGDAIVVAFLEGYGRTPNIETMNGWNIDGTEWRVTLYAKAQMGDPKAVLTNAGV